MDPIPDLTRRCFLGGLASTAVWPGALFAESATGNAPRAARRKFIWEKPDGTATDAVMARRLYLDLAGRIPTGDEARAYVFSAAPRKKEQLVDELLASEDFADYWTMRFCDILRVKSEFPINLWPNAVYVFHRRIRAFVAGNEPWDAFGRALLTAQGSNFRDGEVNFFRATVNRAPEGWAEAVAQTFLDLPPERLPAARRAELASFLSNVRIKNTREWKEEIVYADGPDRRAELCDRLFDTGRAEVAAAFAERIRRWIFGPADTASVPAGGLRLKDLLRSIVLSPAYARGSVTGGFPARRLDAEVLDDAFQTLSGERRDYQSPAPEPFTFLPPERPTVCVEDGSISNGFLTLFGRPARDTGLDAERKPEVTAKQRLYLFNSQRLHRQLGRLVVPLGRNGKPADVGRRPLPGRVADLYWRVLGRAPIPYERQLLAGVWAQRLGETVPPQGKGGRGNGKGQLRKPPFFFLRDVAWCLVNSKEFIFRI